MNKFLSFLALACFAVGSLLAQERTVSGKITSGDDGSNLPGVNITVKGTTIGSISSPDGSYSITVGDGAVLVFSFVGYAAQEVSVGNRSTIDIILQPDTKSLNEVVITALGIQSQKRSLGTSITEVKAEQIEGVRQTNVVNALTGKVAGVRIQASNGMVGSSSSIFIRGFTSFTQSNQPLFVVDGIPIDNGGGGNALQSGVSNSNRAIDLNPDDIESMSVLKGPAAAILYGSRAVNGAIVITTKKGVQNAKGTIDIVSNYNVVEVNRLPEFQNEYGQGIGGFYNSSSLDSWGPKIAGQTVTNYLGRPEQIAANPNYPNDLRTEQLTAYPNNLRDLFRTGSNIQNSVSFKGGTEKSTYVFSYSNTQEDGILANNKLTRNTFRVAATTQFTKKLSGGASATYFNTASQRTQQGNSLSNPLFRGYFLPRSYNLQGYPFKNPDGSSSYYDAVDNPYWTIENNIYKDRVDRILANADLTYNFTDWLTASFKIGTDAYIYNFDATDGVGAYGGTLGGFVSGGAARAGGTVDANDYNQTTNTYFTLRANKKFGDFGIDVLAGNEINTNFNRFNGVAGVGASVAGFQQITSYTTYTPFSTTTKSRLVGLFAQVETNYKEFLYLTLTGRNDWSSTFAPGKRSYFYPSAAVSFVFSDAFPFLKNSDVFSYGKIRANIVKVGRQAPAYTTDTYFFRANPANGYGPGLNFPFSGLQGFSLGNIAGNPDLGPEFTVSKEIGTELQFLKNRIGLDLTYFETNSTNILVEAPLSVASGFSNVQKNVGELKSTGWELGLSFSPFRSSQGFSWEINANWTKIVNTVVSIDPLVNTIFLGGFTTPQTQLQAGQPYGVIVGNPFNRDAAGNILITATGAGAGQPTANTAAVSVLGNPNPDWTAGMTNTFSYKGLSLSFLLDIRKGGDIISRNIRDVRFRGVAVETGDRDRTYIVPGVLRDPVNNADGTPRALVGADGQTVPNNITLNAQQYWTSLYNTQGEAIVFDASWIRLREASISYSIPKKVLERSPFGKIEVAITGRNLLLYTPNYPHFDPEVNSQGVNNSQGFEFNTLPQTRTFGALVRLSF
ncbi:MAG: SusC/RagA family TonB-linked outer membrane protein [Verrucomicrobia bacterium]|nr:SusC/RagA family TonB-linked outer membrane protein [Cytophagales bacterium]